MADYFSETHCRNGHKRTIENTSYSEKGTKRCLDCKRASNRRMRANPVYAAKERESGRIARREARARKRLEGRDVAKYDDKKTAVQRVLGIKPEAMPAHEAMSEWFESNRSPCFEQPELYSDYDDPRYPEDATGIPMPSTGQAEALCADCPIRTPCLEFALKNKEDFGIWGGKRIVAGRIYQGGSGRVKKEGNA